MAGAAGTSGARAPVTSAVASAARVRVSVGGTWRCLSDRAAIALPGAIIVLFMVTLLIVAVITVSVQSSTSATRDNGAKIELEAAEAGLQVARHRLSQLKPEGGECINETKRLAAGEKSESETYWQKVCKDSPESLGNGVTYQYLVSLPLAAGSKCGGRTVESVPSGTTYRCITAEGKMAGVESPARLQTRVKASTGEPLFPVKGVLGLSEVKVTGSVKVPGVVASNESITGEGSAAFDKGFELCPPKGSFKPAAGKERTSSGVTVGGKKEAPPLEKTRAESECPFKAKLPSGHATAASNQDSRIGKEDEFFTEGKEENKFTGWPKYELSLFANSKLTLGGSKYYFCKVVIGSNGELKIASGAKVEVFIDSPEDPESKCAKGTGTFTLEGAGTVKNPNGPAALLIEMYGKGPFLYTNGTSCKPNACLEASVYAPEATVEISGGTTFKGGIVANKVHLEAGAGIFEWGEETGSLTAGVASAYGRQVWEQCTPGSGIQGC